MFILASMSDFVDGYIARHYNQVSDFGKFLDPLADKLLVISCMVIFVQWGRMPAWALMVVLTREFAVTGLRLVAVEGGRVIAAAMSGKVKTVLQMALIILLTMPIVGGAMAVLTRIVEAAAVIMTLYSMVEYVWKNRQVLGGAR